MKQEFISNQVFPISAGAPSTVKSTIQVSNLEGNIRDVNVTLTDLKHSWTEDLRIHLESPNGTRVLLVSNQGFSGDHFQQTVFDDSATKSIVGGKAPFEGSFRPQEKLTGFEGENANGTWTLIVEDQVAQDGGSLNSWSLQIETCRHNFLNDRHVMINPEVSNVIESTIDTSLMEDLGGMVVENLSVLLDIEHTWDADLHIMLIGPAGTQVVLVARRGGSGDGFHQTRLTDDADKAVSTGSAPFTGHFRPEEPLVAFRNKIIAGVWTLRVEDRARQDGGMLKSWALQIDSSQPAPQISTNFTITLDFVGGLTANQRSVFQLAAARWAEVITGNLPRVTFPNGDTIDDVVIHAEGQAIDGPGRILAQAGPSYVRVNSGLPYEGIMIFDTADLADMERDGTFKDIILHEMGHVLGIGPLWGRKELLTGTGTNNPEYIGDKAMVEYAKLLGETMPRPIPVANTGGLGTAEKHWRETTFDYELMTGYAEPRGVMPLSRMTVASLEDLGYEVNYEAADPYVMPAARPAAVAAPAAGPAVKARHFCKAVPPPVHEDLFASSA